MSSEKNSKREKQIGWLGIRCAPTFHDALKAAAAKREISASDYVRAAVEKQLKRDGVSITEQAE